MACHQGRQTFQISIFLYARSSCLCLMSKILVAVLPPDCLGLIAVFGGKQGFGQMTAVSTAVHCSSLAIARETFIILGMLDHPED